MADATTSRLRRNLKARTAAFMAAGPSAGRILATMPADARVVYLTGDRPPSWLVWALADLPDGWEPGGHYLDAVAPVLRYNGPHGRRLELHRAAQWFGAGDYTPAEASWAWEILSAVIHDAFRGSTLLATPATTGRELFLRTIPRDRSWPVLSDDLQNLIRATDGQGRTEVIPPRLYRANLPALFEYDGRMMYAALCWGLPMGVPHRDTLDEYAGMQRARYRVRVTVPRDWHLPFGLVGTMRDDGSRLWRYPADPGETFETWIDGAEMHVIDRHAPTWKAGVRILERLLWAPHEGQGKGPLDGWAAKLIACRELIDGARSRLLDAGVPADGLPRAQQLAGLGIRALLLHGIGAFHGRPHVMTHYLPTDRAADVPTHATSVRLEGDYIVYGIAGAAPEPGSWRARLSHPEWSAAVWARARARLVAGPQSTGALFATGEVVGFRTDAIYLTERQRWHDDERVGRLRLKRELVDGPYPWPTNGTELIALRERGEVAS